jgi:hypothetical protein
MRTVHLTVSHASSEHLPFLHELPLNVQNRYRLLYDQILKDLFPNLRQGLDLFVVIIPFLQSFHFYQEFQPFCLLHCNLFERRLFFIRRNPASVLDIEPGENLLHRPCAVHVVLGFEVCGFSLDNRLVVVGLDCTVCKHILAWPFKVEGLVAVMSLFSFSNHKKSIPWKN